jgi:hypothetical protein
MQSNMTTEQLEDRYAEFVPPYAPDRHNEGEFVIHDAQEQEKLWGRQEKSAIKVTDKSIDDCICFIDDLQRKYSEIKEQVGALLQLELRIREMQLGMCNCFPSEYDGDRLLVACYYVPVFVEKSEHWSLRHVDRQEREKYKEAYLYARDIWSRMTKRINAHNFEIGKLENDTEVFFTFTVSNIPGKFQVTLPIGKKFGVNQKKSYFLMNSPMQIRMSYAMATMENVYHSIGRTYDVDDVSTLLKEFVETDGYKKYLPSPTIEHRDWVDEHEIVWSETQEIPQSIWDAIEKSRQEASKERTTL